MRKTDKKSETITVAGQDFTVFNLPKNSKNAGTCAYNSLDEFRCLNFGGYLKSDISKRKAIMEAYGLDTFEEN